MRTRSMHVARKACAGIAAMGLAFLLLAGCGVEPSAGPLTDQQVRALASGIASGIGQQSGIHVSAQGSVSAEPDLAVLTLGVEARAATVEAARADAAAAMTGVMSVLRQQGIAERDIQTRHFTIQPVYRYDTPQREPVLVGYRVANTVTAKIRALESVGPVIDAVAAAGGDAARIEGIQFTIEDTASLEEAARDLAVQNALAKAQQVATSANVRRGAPLFISESLGFTHPPAQRGEADMAPGDTTPISPGVVEVRVSVQAIFAIQ